MLYDYDIDYTDVTGLDQNVGMNYFTQERIEDYITALQDFKSDGTGFNFIIHAIGDRGVRYFISS